MFRGREFFRGFCLLFLGKVQLTQKSSKKWIVLNWVWLDRARKTGLENHSYSLSGVFFHCKSLREEAYEQKRRKPNFSQDWTIFTFDKDGHSSQPFFSNSAFITECERAVLKRIRPSWSGSTDPNRYPLVKQTYATGKRISSSYVRPRILIEASFEPSD